MSKRKQKDAREASGMSTRVLFSTQRLATRWDSSVFTVRRLIKSGDLPALMIGGRFYVRADVVEQIEKTGTRPCRRIRQRADVQRISARSRG